MVAEDTWVVPSGQFIEIDFDMNEGDTVQIQATAPQPFFWDVHYHDEEGAIHVVDEGTTDSLSYSLEGQINGLHSILIQNDGDTDYEVDVLVEGAADFVNFRRG